MSITQSDQIFDLVRYLLLSLSMKKSHFLAYNLVLDTEAATDAKEKSIFSTEII